MAKAEAIMKRLLAAALKYPEAYEDRPWGHSVAKVKGKIFAFLSADEGLGLSAKLPLSAEAALMLPFASPTGYGLGKAGWISASFPAGADVPEGLLLEWIDESYRAVAPKKLVKALPPFGAEPPAPDVPVKKPVAKKPVAKKPVAKKPAAKKPAAKKR